jgi:hypothetical protein
MKKNFLSSYKIRNLLCLTCILSAAVLTACTSDTMDQTKASSQISADASSKTISSISADTSSATISSVSEAMTAAGSSTQTVSDEKPALEQALHQALLGRLDNSPFEELKTEGHVFLGTQNQNSDSKLLVYIIGSYAAFGFENNTFIETQGSSAVPAVLSFSQKDGKYILNSYQEASVEEDQQYLKKLFPSDFQADALRASSYQPELTAQQKKQADAYLKKIGRSAEVLTSGDVSKQLFHISSKASNSLLAEQSLQDYPYWAGTREALSGSVRTVYESQEQDLDGYVLITYLKKDASGTVLQKNIYKVEGDQINKLTLDSSASPK